MPACVPMRNAEERSRKAFYGGCGIRADVVGWGGIWKGTGQAEGVASERSCAKQKLGKVAQRGTVQMTVRKAG